MIPLQQNFPEQNNTTKLNNFGNTILPTKQIQVVNKDNESTTFIRDKNLLGKITHIKYQWVTDPNASKIVDLSRIPDSLVDSLAKLNQSKNINLIETDVISSRTDKGKILIVFREILELILEQIKNQIFTGLIKGKESGIPFSKGIKKYLYYLEYNPKLKNEHQRISDLIDLINYPPLILSVNESKFPVLPGERDEYTTVGQAEYIRLQAIAGLRTIIEVIVRKKEQLPIRNVIQETISDQKIKSGIISIFTPHDQNNRMIYVSPERKKEYEVFYPLELYYGWRYFSDSPLTLYVIKNTPFNPPIRKIEGNYIIPTMSRYNSVFNQGSLEIRNLMARGYLALNLEMPIFRILDHSVDLTPFMDHKMEIYSNLITRFGHKMITPRTDYTFNINAENKSLFKWCDLINTCINDDLTDSPSPKNTSIEIIMYGSPIIQPSCKADQIGFLASWLDDSVDNIIHNKLPMVTFKGAWQEIESGSKSKIMAKLKYVAHIAYHDLVMNHQYLSSSVLLVDVLEDLSIVAPLTSREEMEEFRTEIERILFQDGYKDWSIFTVTTQSKLLATRLVLLEKLPRASAFGVNFLNEHNKPLYLVVNQRIEPTFFNNINSLAEEYVRKRGPQLNHYIENIPIASLGKVSSWNSKKYIDRNTFLRSYDINSNISPTTEIGLDSPMTPKSLSKLVFYPEGLMGLFDIDLSGINQQKEILLRGLYKNPPYKRSVPINFGQVAVEGFLPADTFRNEWIMTVNVKLFKNKDKTEQFKIIPLFDLSYMRINVDSQGKTMVVDYSSEEVEISHLKPQELSKSEQEFTKQIENVVNWLWKRGMFISSWGKAITSNNDINIETEIEPYGLIEINDTLKDAYQEPDSGDRAVNYLNQMAKLSS
uniref:Uncharacterized protein n=1 Tax=Pithovirus LCPAC202 TaxID=2506592 RepID=A0A481Z728_9VIRU|nr:MAG: hypothetical protein LCPAC202_01860 [Pithovirus LCPAC202]